ncbi:biofilm formation regulator BssS, partial [Salmonella enterica]|nr:biofilm formation regulator BssS [Salmonella enterica]
FLSLSVILCNCQCIKGDRSGGHRTR